MLKLSSKNIKAAAGPAVALTSAFGAGVARGKWSKHRKWITYGGAAAGAGMFLFAKNDIVRNVGLGLGASSLVAIATGR